jgi:hypothetical protein
MANRIDYTSAFSATVDKLPLEDAIVLGRLLVILIAALGPNRSYRICKAIWEATALLPIDFNSLGGPPAPLEYTLEDTDLDTSIEILRFLKTVKDNNARLYAGIHLQLS